jgi:hypothetical protein
MTTPEITTNETEEERIFCHRRNCPGSTGLRCYQTGVPICMKCSVRTPVGYISKDAAKDRADKFFNISVSDYVVVATIAFMGTLITGFFAVSFLGFLWFLLIFIGPALGGIIGEMIFRGIRRRRGRYTRQIVIGSMIAANIILFFVTGNLLALGIFAFTATSAAIARLQVAL